MKTEIIQYYNNILSDANLSHRYRSWEHCFSAFSNEKLTNDIKSLHLAFYLASWGMYRGSSGLLWKDYTIHENVVRMAENHPELHIRQNTPFPQIEKIQFFFQYLYSYYSSITYNTKNQAKNITATDALISKIMLGIFGVIPAFDRYFILGAKNILRIKSFKIKHLPILYKFAEDNFPQIEICQTYIVNKTGFWYPPMKIIDMYFWQIGYNLKSLPKY